jgi:hypothetical protein
MENFDLASQEKLKVRQLAEHVFGVRYDHWQAKRKPIRSYRSPKLLLVLFGKIVIHCR